MSKADELIAGLQTAAEFDSAGSFSLDREKARQKMRQFQLADPHRYVLLLVEAAALRGATRITFEIDADDMRMRFDAALDWEDLDELYTSLFVDRSTVAIRARRELALACNAVMALNPRWARIESWTRDDHASAGVRAILRPDADDEIERFEPDAAADRGSWTTVHVKDRFRPGLLVRFLNDLGDGLPEERLIRTRCALASLSITLDGARVSHGLPRFAIAAVAFEDEGLRGVAGLHPTERERSALVLLSNGVEISTTELNDSVPGLWFWVDGSSFRKDVSQAEIVRSDPTYERMLAAVARARDQVLGRLVEGWAAGEFNHDQAWSADRVFDLLRDCFVRWADANWLTPEAGPLGRLGDLPLWRTVERQWISPRKLLEQADRPRGIMYTSRDFDGVQPLGWGPIVHVLDGLEEIAALGRIYGARAVDATDVLEREVPWELNRRRWRTRQHPPELPRGAVGAVDFATEDFRGQIALSPGRSCNVRLVVDGCLLCELEPELGPFGLTAVLSGPLTPASDHARVRHDRAFATGVLLLLAQLPRLISQAAAHGQAIRDSLLALVRPSFATTWLEAFGFSNKSATQLVARLGTPELLPELGLGTDRPTAVARELRFQTVDHRSVSLVEIDAERRARVREPGKLLFVYNSAPRSEALTELILWIDPGERWLLTAIFGSASMHDDTDAHLRELGRRRFLARPLMAPRLPHATWTAVIDRRTEDGVAITGFVGVNAIELRSWKADQPRKASVDVIVEERRLTTVEVRAWLPGVVASLRWDGAPVNRTWDGLDGALAPVEQAVDAGLLDILRSCANQAIEARTRPDEDVRRLLWLAMATPFISVEHAAAWRRLRAELEFGEAVATYHELLLQFPSFPLSDLREGIALLIEGGRLPTAAAVREILMVGERPTIRDREFHRGVLELYETLERVPLISLVSGQDINLADLSASFAKVGEIAHVEDLSLRYETSEYTVVRADPIDHVALIRLFGREAFKEVSAWIHERLHQQRFESRAQLEDIRLPEHNRMVGVEFEREGVRGELAIPPWVPGDAGVMKLTYCHGRRVVEKIELHANLPVLGIIDDPEAELSSDYKRVITTGRRMATIRKLLDEVLDDELLSALARAYPELSARHQSLARAWIVAHWRKSSPRAGTYPNRLSKAGKLFAELKLFMDVDGTPRSLAELAERYREHRKLWYVERDPGHSVPPPFPIVLRRADDEHILDALFSELDDFGARWRDCVDGHERRRRARDLPPAVAPETALIAAKIERHELVGAIWLPHRYPFDDGVILGADGKVLVVESVHELLPVQGVIAGVTADDRFEHVVLNGPQARYLDSRAIFLYAELLNHHQRDMRRPERADFLEPAAVARRSVTLDLLRAAAVSIARARRHGRAIDAILGNLERRLDKEPLLRLASGRLISVEVARSARPQELAHLDIWDPAGPALSLAEQARLLLGEVAEVLDTQAEPLTSTVTSSVAVEVEKVMTEVNEFMAEVEAELEPLTLFGSTERDDGPDSAGHVELEGVLESIKEAARHEFDVVAPRRDRIGEVLEQVREELRLLRERHEIVLTEGQLDAVTADVRNGRELVRIEDGVVFDSEHPRFLRAIDDPDPIWISFLASVAYTALNRWLEEVTDNDERVFHHRHSQHLLSALLENR